MNNLHKFDIKTEVLNFIYLVVGTFLSALAINVFFVPNNLSMGGVSGVATSLVLISNNVIPFGLFSLMINIPILLLGWKEFGFKMVYRSLIGTLVFSFGIDLANIFMDKWFAVWISALEQKPDIIIFSIFAGVTFGIGLGLILRGGYNIGGVDILALIAVTKTDKITIGQFIFFTDFMVIIFSTVVNYIYGVGDIYFALLLALYSFVALFITSKLTDFVILGTDSSKACHIISSHSDEISQAILTEMDRGVTGIMAKGMYTNNDKLMLYVVLNSREIPDLKRIVEEIDPEAFIIINEVKDVSGEGFTIEKKQMS